MYDDDCGEEYEFGIHHTTRINGSRALRRACNQKYFPKQETLGTRVGDYVANVIDISIGRLKRLRGLIGKLNLSGI